MTRDATIKFQGYTPYPPVDKVDDWGLNVAEQVRAHSDECLLRPPCVHQRASISG